MNRCPRPLLAAAATACCVALAGAAAFWPAQAQAQRIFPNTAKRGEITFISPPQKVMVNGQPESLAIGVRVLDQHNRIPLAGSLRGKSYIVNYVRDPAGKIRQVWLLTEKEAARPGKSELERPSVARSPARAAQLEEHRRANLAPGGLHHGN